MSDETVSYLCNAVHSNNSALCIICNFLKRIDKQALFNDEILGVMDSEVTKARRRQLEEIDDYRKAHQQAHQRRDYDLYDPLNLKKSLPARIGDNDPRTGASSLQKFEGEDLGKR
jgi:hypothetical protein